MTAIPHGTTSGYKSGGCRCPACRAAHRDYQRARRAHYAQLPDKQVPHGTVNGYTNYGCRCDACKKAFAAGYQDYCARQRRERSDA